MQYNCKLITYANGRSQLRVYSYDIINDFKNDKKGGTRENKEKTDEDITHSIEVSKNRTINAIYDIARSNVWDFFITMTFDEERVNRYDYDDCIRSMAKYIQFLQKKYCKDMTYLLVPEKHKKGGYHIHALIGNCKNIPKVKAINHSEKHFGELLIDKHGRQIYNLPNYIYGFSTATIVDDNFAACAYMCKYVTKDLQIECKNRKRYIASHNCKKPVEEVIKLNDEQIENLIDINIKKMLYNKVLHYKKETVSYFEFDNIDKIYNFENINGCSWGE